MRPLMVVILAMLVGCQAGGNDDPSPVDLPPEDQADAYLVVISAGADGGGPLWISEQVCTDAGSSPTESGEGECAAMEPDVRAALAERLPEAQFTDDFTGVQDDIFKGGGGVIWRLGPVEGSGDRVTISASYYCGGLCAGGGTHVVERIDGSWEETGMEGPVWMS